MKYSVQITDKLSGLSAQAIMVEHGNKVQVISGWGSVITEGEDYNDALANLNCLDYRFSSPVALPDESTE